MEDLNALPTCDSSPLLRVANGTCDFHWNAITVKLSIGMLLITENHM